MNFWLWGAAGLLLALVPAGVVCFRGSTEDRLTGLELAGSIVVLELIALAEGFHRNIDMDLPLTLAILGFGSGLVFARFLQRWL